MTVISAYVSLFVRWGGGNVQGNVRIQSLIHIEPTTDIIEMNVRYLVRLSEVKLHAFALLVYCLKQQLVLKSLFEPGC